MNKGQSKCFKNDIPRDTLIMIEYELKEDSLQLTDEAGKYLSIQFYDPKGNSIAEQKVTERKQGKITVFSNSDGVYKACVASGHALYEDGREEVMFSLKMDNEVRQDDCKLIPPQQFQVFDDAVKDEDFDEIEEDLEALKIRAEDIIGHQRLDARREYQYYESQNKFGARIVWLTVAQILLVAGAAVYQVLSLKSFFIRRHIC